MNEIKCIPLYNHLGEMAEWSIAAVLKTVEGHTSGGSNPSLSAQKKPDGFRRAFSVYVPLSKFLRILSTNPQQWLDRSYKNKLPIGIRYRIIRI